MDVEGTDGQERRRGKRSSCETLVEPKLSVSFVDFQYSVHSLSNMLKRELASVFPSQHFDLQTQLLLVPTMQRSQVELLQFGDHQAVEKDRLLERFFEWSTMVRDAVQRLDEHAWVDVTDPASGTARWGAQGSVYSDVYGMLRTLKYPTQDIGGCLVLEHPHWHFFVYPGR